MSILDAGKLVLFSEMQGQLLIKGEPVKNAKIRRVAHFDKDIVDFAITDEEGRFHFPEASIRSVTKFLPAEFTARQELWVNISGSEEQFWYGVKAQDGPNSEARGSMLNPICELSNDQQIIWVDGGVYETKCTWGVEPDKRKNPF